MLIELRYEFKVYILQHTATHCNTLQHTATHCNILTHAHIHKHMISVHTGAACHVEQKTVPEKHLHIYTHTYTRTHTHTHTSTHTINIYIGATRHVERPFCRKKINIYVYTHTHTQSYIHGKKKNVYRCYLPC